MMTKYDRLREERKNEFQEDVIEAVDRVDKETERVLEETRNFEQEQTEAAEKEAEQRAQIQREEEQRRHREQLAAQDGGLSIGGTLSSKIHKQKMKFKRRRIESTSGAEDWGELDQHTGPEVETHRPLEQDTSSIILRGRVTGVPESSGVTAFFEWRDVEERVNWLRNRDMWSTTEKQPLTRPGLFSEEVTDIDPETTYELRTVMEFNGDRVTGETVLYPDDAAVTTSTNVDEALEQLPETPGGDER